MTKIIRVAFMCVLSLLILVSPMGLSQVALANQETKTDPQLAYAHSALGYIYNGQEKYREALAEYVCAMELDPDNEVYQGWVVNLQSKADKP